MARGRMETLMKRIPPTVILTALIILTSACTSQRLVMRQNDAAPGAIVIENRDNPGQLYIMVKSKIALDDTLTQLHCNKRPCIIGRLGEVYVVDQPSVD